MTTPNFDLQVREQGATQVNRSLTGVAGALRQVQGRATGLIGPLLGLNLLAGLAGGALLKTALEAGAASNAMLRLGSAIADLLFPMRNLLDLGLRMFQLLPTWAQLLIGAAAALAVFHRRILRVLRGLGRLAARIPGVGRAAWTASRLMGAAFRAAADLMVRLFDDAAARVGQGLRALFAAKIPIPGLRGAAELAQTLWAKAGDGIRAALHRALGGPYPLDRLVSAADDVLAKLASAFDSAGQRAGQRFALAWTRALARANLPGAVKAVQEAADAASRPAREAGVNALRSLARGANTAVSAVTQPAGRALGRGGAVVSQAIRPAGRALGRAGGPAGFVAGEALIQYRSIRRDLRDNRSALENLSRFGARAFTGFAELGDLVANLGRGGDYTTLGSQLGSAPFNSAKPLAIINNFYGNTTADILRESQQAAGDPSYQARQQGLP